MWPHSSYCRETIILKNLLNVKEVTIVKNIKFITGKEIESQVQKRFVLAINMMKSTQLMINNVEVRIVEVTP